MDVIVMDMGPDVKGGCDLDGFRGKIELLSFSHPVVDKGRPAHREMTVTKYGDAASPALQQSCNEGRSFPQVEVVVGHKDGGAVVVLMRYTMRDCLISSVSVTGGPGDRPVETVALNYNQIKQTFAT